MAVFTSIRSLLAGSALSMTVLAAALPGPAAAQARPEGEMRWAST